MLIGCMIGAVLAANIADRIGRKNSMLLLAPLTFFGFFGMAFAGNIWVLSTLKLIIGITDGAMFTILPMYIGEIVDADIRGFLSSTVCLLFIFGILLISVIGSVMSIFSSSLVLASIPTIHFILMLLMPESPYFFVKIEKYEMAKYSLKVFRGEDKVESELENLKRFVLKQNKSESSFMKIFTVPTNRKAILIFTLLTFANRMSGKAAIMLFTSKIFLESGSTISASLSVILYNVVELIVVFVVTFFIIDRFGRKFLMVLSCFGSSLTIFSLAVYFYLLESGSSLIYSLNSIPIISLLAYNVLFSIGLGFGGMTYLSELFSMDVKAKASCLGELLTVSMSFASSYFFQITLTYFGMYFPFLCFAFCSGISGIFIFKLVPETKGKSLAEIQDILGDRCKTKSPY